MRAHLILVAGEVDKTVERRALPTTCAKCGRALVYDPRLLEHTLSQHAQGSTYEYRCHGCAAHLVAAMTDEDLDRVRALANAQPEFAHRIEQYSNDEIRRMYGARSRQ